MTSWGNTRQRAAAYAAVILFALAMLLATTSLRGWALLPMMAGFVCTAGVWALGLPQRMPSPDDAEWRESAG